MDILYLIEYSYRALYFINFLEQSLNNLKKVPETNEKNQKLSLTEKQMKFRQINDDNLFEYQKFEKTIEITKIENVDSKKVEYIKNWANSNKIKYSNILDFEEIYNISNKIYEFYINTLNKLKIEKNIILHLLFPQLIRSLFDSFKILNELMSIFLKEKNTEKNNFNKLFLKTEENENNFKEIKLLKKNNKQYENIINDLNTKINGLLNENIILKKNLEDCKNNNKIEKNILLNNTNESLFIDNQYIQSELNFLKEEMLNGKEELKALKKLFEEEQNERKALKKLFEEEQNERKIKLEKKNNEMKKNIEENYEKTMQKIKEIFNQQKQELLSKFQNND